MAKKKTGNTFLSTQTVESYSSEAKKKADEVKKSASSNATKSANTSTYKGTASKAQDSGYQKRTTERRNQEYLTSKKDTKTPSKSTQASVQKNLQSKYGDNKVNSTDTIKNLTEGTLKQIAGGHLKSIGTTTNEVDFERDKLKSAYTRGKIDKDTYKQNLEALNKSGKAKMYDTNKQKAANKEGLSGKLMNKTESFYDYLAKKGNELNEAGDKQVEKANKNLNTFEKIASGAYTSGIGMATDMLAGPMWGASMMSRTFGNELGSAKKQGADTVQDAQNAGLQAAKEWGSELIFGGIAAPMKIAGKGMGYTEKLLDKAVSKITNQTAKNAVYSIGKRLASSLEEGAEEVIAGLVEPIIQNKTYADELGIHQDIKASDIVEAVASAGLMTAVMGAGSAAMVRVNKEHTKASVDFLGGEKELAKIASNVDDPTMASRAEANYQRLEGGNALADEQVSEMLSAVVEQADITRKELVASRQAVYNKVTKEDGNFVLPLNAVERYNLDGSPVLREGPTAEAHDEYMAEAMDKIASLTSDEAQAVATSISNIRTGIATVSDVQSFSVTEPESRAAFEEATGLKLPVIYNKNSTVNSSMTNYATRQFLIKQSMESARTMAERETANFVDTQRGAVNSDVMQGLGKSGASVFHNYMDGQSSLDSKQYYIQALAFRDAYNAARTGAMSLDQLLKINNPFRQGLDELIKSAYESGEADRNAFNDVIIKGGKKIADTKGLEKTDAGIDMSNVKEENYSMLKESDREVFEDIARMFNLKIVFFDDAPGKNGFYDNGVVYLNINNEQRDRDIDMVFRHEFTHHIRTYAPAQYKELEDLVRQRWYKGDSDAYAKAIQGRIDLYAKHEDSNGNTIELTEEGAVEELIADISGELDMSLEDIRDLAATKPSLFQAILDALRNIITKIRLMLGRSNGYAYKYNRKILERLDIYNEYERLFTIAAREAYANRAKVGLIRSGWKGSLAYHAGDLGKSTVDDYWNQGYGRDTGHFGFGTYFVGDESQINDYGYGKRSHYAVDFDKYNLYRPGDFQQALDLHDGLRILDGYAEDYSKLKDVDIDAKVNFRDEIENAITEYEWNAPQDLTDISEDQLWMFESDADEYERGKSYLLNLLDKMDSYTKDQILFAADRRYNELHMTEDEAAAMFVEDENRWRSRIKADDADVTFQESIEEAVENKLQRWNGDKKSNEMFDREDFVVKEIIGRSKDYISRQESDWERVDRAENLLVRGLGYRFTAEEIDNAIRKTEQIVSEYEDYERGNDSAATVFMKQLGFDGVDVRHIPEMDNVGFGSVIYELKGEDLAKKQEIGTAKYSISESQMDQDYNNAIFTGNIDEVYRLIDKAAEIALSDSKIRDENGKLMKMYQGTVQGGYTVLDKSKAHVGGNSGAGFYYTNIEDDALENYMDIEGAGDYFKVQSLADRLFEDAMDDPEYDGPIQSHADAVIVAQSELKTAPMLYEVYLDSTKPYIRDFDNSTNLYDEIVYTSYEEAARDFNIDAEEYSNEDEYEEAIYDAIYEDAYKTVNTAVWSAYNDFSNYYEIIDEYNFDVESIVGDLTMHLMDYNRLTWRDILDIVGNITQGGLEVIRDERTDSGFAETEFTRAIIEAFGYDSIFDKEVSRKFNQMKALGIGTDEGAAHVIIFNPNQAKSRKAITRDDAGNIIPLSERFDITNNDLRYSVTETEYNQFRQERANTYNDILKGIENGMYNPNEFDMWYSFYSKWQIGECNKDNFFYSTMCDFKSVSRRPNRKPNFVSYSKDGNVSSEYWYTDKGVVRGSKHWGKDIASCDWAIDGKHKESLTTNMSKTYGYADWSDFVFKTFEKEIDGKYYLVNFDNTIGKGGAATDTDKGISDNGAAITDGGSVVKYSLASWNETDIEALTDALKEAGFEDEEIGAWIENVNSVASVIADDMGRLNYAADAYQKALKDNDEYYFTLDLSTLCQKRRLYQGTYNAIMKRIVNKGLHPEDTIHLRYLMDDLGYETPCGICYEESRKKNEGKFAEVWLNGISDRDWNAKLKAYDKSLKKYEENLKEYEAGNKKRKPKVPKKPERWLGYANMEHNDKYIPTIDDVTTTDGRDMLRENHPEALENYLEWQKGRGSANPKVSFTHTDYRGDILKLAKAQIESLKHIGGLRIQSFSDFETVHVIDMMQAVLDMAAMKLTSQAYTKVPAFADIFGGTGIKINLSLIGQVKDGKLVFDAKEGIDPDEAFRIREKYSDNVGTILVGANTESILAAWADDRIDMVIPFHRSGWGKREFKKLGLGGYEDFQTYQTEKYLDGEHKDGVKLSEVKMEAIYSADYWDYTKTGKENAEAYLKLCAEKHYRPVFYNFLHDNGDGTWSLQEDGSTDGYWKSLVDYKMYNNEGKAAPQQEVKPIFDMEVAQATMDAYEGNADTLPVAEDVVDKFVDWFNNKGKKYSVVSVEEDVAYMSAIKDNDMDTVQRMVDEAAKRAGYNLVAYHGTTRGGFTVFNTENGLNNNMGSHFGSKEVAEGFASGEFGSNSKGNSQVYKVYLKSQNPYETFDWFGQDDYYPAAVAKELADEIGTPEAYAILEQIKGISPNIERIVNNPDEVEEGYIRNDVDREFPDISGTEARRITDERKAILYGGIRNLLELGGYDSIQYENGLEVVGDIDTIIQRPEQIKSADPITYDDNDNIIPLSQRFNSGNEDIRYSIGGGYDGYSMSNRAREAYDNGEKPMSKWTKADILSVVAEERPDLYKSIKSKPLNALKNELLYKSSWHHTSSMYNVTNFYSVNRDVLESLTEDGINKWDTSKPVNDVVQFRGDIHYIEWAGTKRRPKAISKVLTDVNIEQRGSFYYVTDDNGKELLKKKIGSNGTSVVDYEAERKAEEARTRIQNEYRDNSSAKANALYDDMLQQGYEKSGTGNMYYKGRKPNSYQYDNLSEFLEPGEQRLANEYYSSGARKYTVETWNGNEWIPEDTKYSAADAISKYPDDPKMENWHQETGNATSIKAMLRNADIRFSVPQMNVLVACEESQAVCKELRKLGHNAYSCDIQEQSGGHPEWHIKGDVSALLNGNCDYTLEDGTTGRQEGKWDMIIAFPPCTHLAVSGAMHFKQKRADGSQREAIEFFCSFFDADCDKLVIENPVNIIGHKYMKDHFPDILERYEGKGLKYAQIVQPWMFGDKAQKKTCLWLKGVPELVPDITTIPDDVEFKTYITKDGKTKKFSADYIGKSGKDRSKTYPGIASAMANTFAGDARFSVVDRDFMEDFINDMVDDVEGLEGDEAELNELRQNRSDFLTELYAAADAIVKKQTQLTNGAILDEKKVKADVQKLLEYAMQNSDYTGKYKNSLKKEIVSALKVMHKAIVDGNAKKAGDIAYKMSSYIVDSIELTNDAMYKASADLRDYLRTTSIAVSDKDKSDIDWAYFMRHNFGRMKLTKDGIGIDKLWDEILPMLRGLANTKEYNLDEIVATADMLNCLSDTLDRTLPVAIVRSSAETMQLMSDITNDLYDIAYDAESWKSFADKKKIQYDEKTKRLKERQKEAIRELRNNYNKKLNDTIREERLAKTRAVNREKARGQKKLVDYKQKVKNAAERKKYFQEKARQHKGIARSYDTLVKMLLEPNTKSMKLVPEEFRKTVASLLVQLDLQTQKSKDLEKTYGISAKTYKAGDIRKALKEIADNESENFMRDESHSEYIAGLADFIDKQIEWSKVRDMDIQTMSKLNDFLATLISAFNTHNQTFVNEKHETISEAGQKISNEANDFANDFGTRKTYQGLRGTIDKLTAETSETPLDFFELLGPAWTDTYMELRRGMNKNTLNMDYLRRYLSDVFGSYFNKNKPGSAIESWREDYAEYTLENGSKITLTPSQIMSLYCHSKRTQSMGHIMVGGVAVSQIVQKATGKDKLLGAEVKTQSQATTISYADIEMLVGTLSKEQLGIADKLQNLLNTTISEWGNETSMEMYGVKLFREKNYFPIAVSKLQLNANLEDAAPDSPEKIMHFGFTKALKPKAGQALVLEDIFKVMCDHCNKMSLYNAYAMAVSDFQRIYNYKEKDAETGKYTVNVQETTEAVYGKQATAYIRKFMADLNGNTTMYKTGAEAVMDGILARYKKAAIGFNPRVAVQQPTAIVRALNVINVKYFIKGGLAGLKDRTRMLEHSPIAMWKSWGNYQNDYTRGLEDIMMNKNWSKMDLVTMMPYGFLDDMTWACIYKAVEAEVKDKHSGVEFESEEYWKLVNDRFDYIIDHTQVVDSVFHRTDAMRSQNGLMKIATSFMAEPSRTFNMVRTDFVKAWRQAKQGDAKAAAKLITRVSLVFIGNAFAVSLVAALIDGLRDDDDDQTYRQKVLEHLLSNFIDNANLLNSIVGVKDLTNLIESKLKGSYYNNTNMLLAGFGDVANAIKDIYKKASGESDKSMWDIFYETSAALGSLTGVPAKNFLRVFKEIATALNIDVDAVDSLEDEETETLLQKLGFTSNKSDDDGVSVKELTDKAKKASSGKSGSAKKESLWDAISDGYTKDISYGYMSNINKRRQAYVNAGGDVDDFNEKILSKLKTEYKKTIGEDDTKKLLEIKDELVKCGMSGDEISEIAKKSNTAQELKAAMMVRADDEAYELIYQLVEAGLTQEDLDYLWEKRSTGTSEVKTKYLKKLTGKSSSGYAWPASGTITDGYGYRTQPCSGASTYHEGLDIAATRGTKVSAAKDGTVIASGYNGAFGYQVVIDHGDGDITYYNHLYTYNVLPGDYVAQGQQIGGVGSTGTSTGNHLDFRIQRNGEYIDPLTILRS